MTCRVVGSQTSHSEESTSLTARNICDKRVADNLLRSDSFLRGNGQIFLLATPLLLPSISLPSSSHLQAISEGSTPTLGLRYDIAWISLRYRYNDYLRNTKGAPLSLINPKSFPVFARVRGFFRIFAACMTRIEREKQTVCKMIELYCRHHLKQNRMPDEYQHLAEFACRRLDHCKYGEQKTAFKECPTHCYAPKEREQIREIGK